MSEEFKEQVRAATNIVEVISGFTELKSSGGQMKGLCPLPGHNEKTPSFMVNEAGQYFYCFGCSRGGDVFKFSELVMGKGFAESLEYFAEKAGIQVPQRSFSGEDKKKHEKKKSLLKANRFASQFYRKNLTDRNIKKANEYLKNRGLTRETLDKFDVGYAQDEWQGLCHEATKHKVSFSFLEELGLIKKSKEKSRYFDIFRDRIVFPILSLNDEVIGFGGRILDEGEPKYLNSPESEVFKKRQTFYGIREALPHIREEGSIILVEGYMDVLSLYQNGVKNVVAALGTAFTAEHAKLLSRYSKKVFVLFDSDTAGFRAKERALPLLLSEGLYPMSLDIKEGKDPDDFVREVGGAEFKKALETKSTDLFVQILRKRISGKKLTPSEKILVLKEMKPFFPENMELGLKRLYLRELSSLLMVDSSVVAAEFGFEKQRGVGAGLQKRARKPQKIQKLEGTLAGLCLSEPKFLEKIMESGQIEAFESESITEILKKAHELYRQGLKPSDNLVALMTDEIEQNGLLGFVMAVKSHQMGEDLDRLFDDCSRKIKERFLKVTSLAMINELGTERDSQKLKKFQEIQLDRSALKATTQESNEG